MMVGRTRVLFVLLRQPIPIEVNPATLGLASEVNPGSNRRLASRLNSLGRGSYPGRITIW